MIEPVSSALAGRFLSTGPLGKSEKWIILIGGKNLSQIFLEALGSVGSSENQNGLEWGWEGGGKEGATLVFPVL